MDHCSSSLLALVSPISIPVLSKARGARFPSTSLFYPGSCVCLFATTPIRQQAQGMRMEKKFLSLLPVQMKEMNYLNTEMFKD